MTLEQNERLFLSGDKLHQSLRTSVINNSPTIQKPLYGAISQTGDEGGDFIFLNASAAKQNQLISTSDFNVTSAPSTSNLTIKTGNYSGKIRLIHSGQSIDKSIFVMAYSETTIRDFFNGEVEVEYLQNDTEKKSIKVLLTEDQIVSIPDKMVNNPSSVVFTDPEMSSFPNGISEYQDAFVQLRGTAIDKDGIKSLMVNGQPVKYGFNGGFLASVSLKEGMNDLKITISDVSGKTTEFNHQLLFEAEKVTDTGPGMGSMGNPALEKMYSMPSRKAMTSGVLDVFQEENAFSKYLLKRLESNTNQFLSAEQLFSSFKLAVINQSHSIPNFGTIWNTGDEGGDFVFVKKGLQVSGNFYALLIGIEEYEDGQIADLSKPLTNARELRSILTDNYNFSRTELLENPTKSEIVSALDRLNKTVKSDDSVLIFYSGHGMWDSDSETGYWIPSDGRASSISEWYSNTFLVDQIRALKGRHTLLIADAVFVGSVFKTR